LVSSRGEVFSVPPVYPTRVPTEDRWLQETRAKSRARPGRPQGLCRPRVYKGAPHGVCTTQRRLAGKLRARRHAGAAHAALGNRRQNHLHGRNNDQAQDIRPSHGAGRRKPTQPIQPPSTTGHMIN